MHLPQPHTANSIRNPAWGKRGGKTQPGIKNGEEKKKLKIQEQQQHPD